MEAENLRSSGTLQGLSSYHSARCHIPERRTMECVRYVVRRKTLTVVCNRSRLVPVLTQYDVRKKKKVLNTLKHSGNYRIFSNLIRTRIQSALVFADFLNEKKVSSRF